MTDFYLSYNISFKIFWDGPKRTRQHTAKQDLV